MKLSLDDKIQGISVNHMCERGKSQLWLLYLVSITLFRNLISCSEMPRKGVKSGQWQQWWYLGRGTFNLGKFQRS